MTQETEREKFEAWCRNKFGAHVHLTRAYAHGYIGNVAQPHTTGSYADVQMLWEAWQARAALEAKQADHVADSGNMVTAHENIREGAPYDCPAFEELARTMGVWGTAQAALCAQFWLKAKESGT